MDAEAYRCRLEQAIIGGCLLEDAFHKVADALTPGDFTKFTNVDHQRIFEAFQGLYPTQPIDILSVAGKISLPGYYSYLSECQATVCSTANIRHHALILVELSMLKELRSKLVVASSNERSTLVKAGINEILEECNGDGDILFIQGHAIGYLKDLGADSSLIESLSDLSQTFNLRLRRLISLSHVTTLMRNLESLSSCSEDPSSRACLAHLTEVIKVVLTGHRLSPETVTKILELSA